MYAKHNVKITRFRMSRIRYKKQVVQSATMCLKVNLLAEDGCVSRIIYSLIETFKSARLSFHRLSISVLKTHSRYE